MTFNTKIKNNENIFAIYFNKFVIISKTIDYWKLALLSSIKRNEDDGRCEIINRNRKLDKVAIAGKVIEISDHIVDVHIVKWEKQNNHLALWICFMFSRNCLNKIQLNQKLYSIFLKDSRNFSLMFNLFWNCNIYLDLIV